MASGFAEDVELLAYVVAARDMPMDDGSGGER